MKTISFVIFIIHFLLNLAIAQWVQQPTGTTMNLNNIKFINKNTGWVCGDGGILKTTNAGENWVILSLPVSKPLQKIFPINSSIVYCVGAFETIIKSTNGGANWQVIRDGTFGTSSSYFCCYFINQNTGWISGGADRKILKTYNGCSSFDSIVTTTSGFIEDIYFKDSLNGLYCDNNGAVRKTTNGGYNWFTINIQVGTISYTFRNFSFVNSQTGWLTVSSQKVFKTTDFGSNWDSIANIPNGSYQIHFIFFSSLNTGYANGEGYNVFKTIDGGYNWIIQDGVAGSGHSIYFVNDAIGWKVGNLGRICHTTNGGQIMQVSNNNEQIPRDFELEQNYPNPFNSQTEIKFIINKKGIYRLEVFDILGRKVDELINKELKVGEYEVKYDAQNSVSGIYIYKLSSDNSFLSKKLLLIK